MTPKPQKTKPKNSRPAKIGRLQASIEQELLLMSEYEVAENLRWDRPRKQQISLRLDAEVVHWFKSKGPGYQTRINRILRRVMTEAKKRPNK